MDARGDQISESHALALFLCSYLGDFQERLPKEEKC